MKSKDIPTTGPALATERAPSVVMVNTGDGKGKSTAAFGTAMRAVARGWKVCVIQFVKSGKWKVGEEKAAISLGIEWLTIGDGFTWDSKNMDRTEAIARHAWIVSKEKISSGIYGLVILDEITYPMKWGWIPTAEVVDVIRNRPRSVNIIATGRDAPME
ncbi:MAG TPA: cob(I)yrinic acid a,c-diamide adenosyltransferase, partial [Candidatus Nitrosopolaris sp.]|nr:cob(I)yrinic acid a,c-diamide adenosyltransferase [Candidatus Nitrosopolaris sp.]